MAYIMAILHSLSDTSLSGWSLPVIEYRQWKAAEVGM